MEKHSLLIWDHFNHKGYITILPDVKLNPLQNVSFPQTYGATLCSSTLQTLEL